METESAGKLHIYRKENEKKVLIRTSDLQIGNNTVGRPSKEKPADIEIPNDDYMSRRHFIIDVYRDSRHNRLHYTLSDNHSRNGTFFYCEVSKSQHKLKTDDEVSVAKGDEIRAGKTYFRIESVEEPPAKDTGTKENIF